MLHISSPNHNSDGINRIIGQRMRQSKTCPLKKSGFSFIFAKNSPAKFRHQKFRPRSITILPRQLSNKQTDLTNALVENERQSEETQWEIGNVKCFRKNGKNLSFFDEKWRKKNREKISQHATQLNGTPSINAKTLAFPSFGYRQDSKINYLLSKKSENWNYRQLAEKKIFGRRKFVICYIVNPS